MTKIVPDTDKPYFIQSKLTALVLDVAQGSTASGAQVIQWGCHEGKNQQWYFEVAGDDSYNIRNANSQLYLQFGDQSDNSGKLIQANKSNQDNQRFTLTPTGLGGVELRTKATGKAIDVPRSVATPGTQLIAWDPHGGPNQSFGLCSKIPRQLQLLRVWCIQPSSGIDLGANSYANWIATFGGAGVGVLGMGTAVAGVATGGTGIAVVGAALGLAGLGTAVAGWIDEDWPDDLYIKVNDRKVWPGGTYQEIGKGETVTLNMTLSHNWTSSDTIQLWEYDTVSSDDALTDRPITIDPVKAMWDTEFTVVKGNPSEGSLYALTFLLS